MKHAISRDGTRIAFDVLGQGPPVIVIGGALNDRTTHRELSQLLADQFSVYDYDRRGRGGSGNTLPYAVERELEDLAAIVGEAGGDASAYGVSSGGLLALQAAAQGIPLRKLALFEPPYQVEPTAASPDAQRDIDALIEDGRPGDAVDYFLARLVGIPAPALAQLRDGPMWPALVAMAPTIGYDMSVTATGSLPSEWLARVSAPTLVLTSVGTAPSLQATARAVASGLPNAELRTLEGQYHAVPAGVLAPVLRAFFTD
jgi:pimeloyl-ACP methyl ester carboxylesterase